MRVRNIIGFLILVAWSLSGAYYTGTATIVTSGTPVQLSTATPTPPGSCISLTVQVLSTNSGTVYIGGSNVSAANKIGIALNSGQTPPASAAFLPSSTTALYSPQALYADSTTSGDKVNVACYK